MRTQRREDAHLPQTPTPRCPIWQLNRRRRRSWLRIGLVIGRRRAALLRRLLLLFRTLIGINTLVNHTQAARGSFHGSSLVGCHCRDLARCIPTGYMAARRSQSTRCARKAAKVGATLAHGSFWTRPRLVLVRRALHSRLATRARVFCDHRRNTPASTAARQQAGSRRQT